jgi:hypothetical protein
MIDANPEASERQVFLLNPLHSSFRLIRVRQRSALPNIGIFDFPPQNASSNQPSQISIQLNHQPQADQVDIYLYTYIRFTLPSPWNIKPEYIILLWTEEIRAQIQLAFAYQRVGSLHEAGDAAHIIASSRSRLKHGKINTVPSVTIRCSVV